ncbi:MAG: calcium-binding protein [Prochlorothrix sp.]|nr:calcium-binding protein [Prochlorothrix sp.]
MFNTSYVEDPDRENRIAEEVLLDTDDIYEEREAWEAYLEDNIVFPFQAHWGDPDTGEVVQVLGFDQENECDTNIFVKVCYQNGDQMDEIDVLLSEVLPIDATEETQQAIEDWQYWVAQGGLSSLGADPDDEY